MSLIEKQQLKNDKAALIFESTILFIIILITIGVPSWFQQEEYIMGMGIGVLYTVYAFFVYFRWERLK